MNFLFFAMNSYFFVSLSHSESESNDNEDDNDNENLIIRQRTTDYRLGFAL